MSLTQRLHKLARRLSRYQSGVIVIGMLALLAAGAIAIDEQSPWEQWLIPSLLLCCWSLLVFILIDVFRVEVAEPDRSAGFLRRLQLRFHRLLRNLLALCFVGLTAALVVLSFKLLGTGVG